MRPLAAFSQGPWSPRNLGGELQLWYDASQFQSLFPGTGVKAWIDRANGNAAIQATGANQPTYSPTGLNGLPALSFNGSSQRLVSAPIALQQQWSAFAVANLNTVAPATQFIMAANAAANASPLRFAASNFAPQGANTVPTFFTAPNITVAASTNYILETFRTGTAIQSSINGGAIGSTATTGTPKSATIGAVFGSNNASGSLFNGKLSEILFFGLALGTAERLLVEGYLAWKWGLQSNLPSTHTFKLNPP